MPDRGLERKGASGAPQSSLRLKDLALPQNAGKITHLLMTPGHLVLREIIHEYEQALEILLREMPETRFTFIIESGECRRMIGRVTRKLRSKGMLGAPERIRVADMRDTVWMSRSVPGGDPVREFAMMKPANPEDSLSRLKGWIAKSADGKITLEIHRGSWVGRTLRKVLKENPEIGEKVSLIQPDEIQHLVRELTMWAQDSTLVLGKKLIIPDRSGSKSEDLDVARLLSILYPEYKVSQTELGLEGGNVIPTSSTVYVGERYLKSQQFTMSGGTAGNEQEEMKAQISAVFPRQRVVIFQNQPKDCFHIDMAFTCLAPNPANGKPRVVVGDVKLAKELLQKMRKENWREFSLANAAISKVVQGWDGGDALYLPDEADTSEAATWLDGKAAELERSGCEVVRVPFLATSQVSTKAPWLTYNNVLIHGKKIFMPVYGIASLDDGAERVYRDAGYEVVRVPLPAISAHWGALNCMTKVLERSFTPAELH